MNAIFSTLKDIGITKKFPDFHKVLLYISKVMTGTLLRREQTIRAVGILEHDGNPSQPLKTVYNTFI
jgi:hypothetical protein